MRISDWSSDVCSSDLHRRAAAQVHDLAQVVEAMGMVGMLVRPDDRIDLAHAGIEKLEPHVGAGVDQQPEAAERNEDRGAAAQVAGIVDRKSTRLNSSH